jgi:NAD(P)-dependent dehydrogenase (short-subunit alcohol dehydrogenase family)
MSAANKKFQCVNNLWNDTDAYTDDEAAESLVTKFAQFYADRMLTKAPITPADQAEAYFLLVSQRFSKTTGQIITVDGGLHEAFLR